MPRAATSTKRKGGDGLRPTGGHCTDKIAATWATILARREMGESLGAITDDLKMLPLTVKTYIKLARKAFKQGKK